ncbi:MAG: hypothetical protein KDD50_10245 [Bdellovibrionales bacterium]|nr:hypothetical protein [Bdellovibrionales bacterium]
MSILAFLFLGTSLTATSSPENIDKNKVELLAEKMKTVESLLFQSENPCPEMVYVDWIQLPEKKEIEFSIPVLDGRFRVRQNVKVDWFPIRKMVISSTKKMFDPSGLYTSTNFDVSEELNFPLKVETELGDQGKKCLEWTDAFEIVAPIVKLSYGSKIITGGKSLFIKAYELQNDGGASIDLSQVEVPSDSLSWHFATIINSLSSKYENGIASSQSIQIKKQKKDLEAAAQYLALETVGKLEILLANDNNISSEADLKSFTEKYISQFGGIQTGIKLFNSWLSNPRKPFAKNWDKKMGDDGIPGKMGLPAGSVYFQVGKIVGNYPAITAKGGAGSNAKPAINNAAAAVNGAPGSASAWIGDPQTEPTFQNRQYKCKVPGHDRVYDCPRIGKPGTKYSPRNAGTPYVGPVAAFTDLNAKLVSPAGTAGAGAVGGIGGRSGELVFLKGSVNAELKSANLIGGDNGRDSSNGKPGGGSLAFEGSWAIKACEWWLPGHEYRKMTSPCIFKGLDAAAQPAGGYQSYKVGQSTQFGEGILKQASAFTVQFVNSAEASVEGSQGKEIKYVNSAFLLRNPILINHVLGQVQNIHPLYQKNEDSNKFIEQYLEVLNSLGYSDLIIRLNRESKSAEELMLSDLSGVSNFSTVIAEVQKEEVIRNIGIYNRLRRLNNLTSQKFNLFGYPLGFVPQMGYVEQKALFESVLTSYRELKQNHDNLLERRKRAYADVSTLQVDVGVLNNLKKQQLKKIEAQRKVIASYAEKVKQELVSIEASFKSLQHKKVAQQLIEEMEFIRDGNQSFDATRDTGEISSAAVETITSFNPTSLFGAGQNEARGRNAERAAFLRWVQQKEISEAEARDKVDTAKYAVEMSKIELEQSICILDAALLELGAQEIEMNRLDLEFEKLVKSEALATNGLKVAAYYDDYLNYYIQDLRELVFTLFQRASFELKIPTNEIISTVEIDLPLRSKQFIELEDFRVTIDRLTSVYEKNKSVNSGYGQGRNRGLSDPEIVVFELFKTDNINDLAKKSSEQFWKHGGEFKFKINLPAETKLLREVGREYGPEYNSQLDDIENYLTLPENIVQAQVLYSDIWYDRSSDLSCQNIDFSKVKFSLVSGYSHPYQRNSRGQIVEFNLTDGLGVQDEDIVIENIASSRKRTIRPLSSRRVNRSRFAGGSYSYSRPNVDLAMDLAKENASRHLGQSPATTWSVKLLKPSDEILNCIDSVKVVLTIQGHESL